MLRMSSVGADRHNRCDANVAPPVKSPFHVERKTGDPIRNDDQAAVGLKLSATPFMQ